MKKPQPAKFYVGGFLLKILDSAYLVQVEPATETAEPRETAANLPDWIFHSAHAIWLTQEEAPLLDRAIRGDQIKNQILNKETNHEKNDQYIDSGKID